ncbi:hypothetical protein Patl1_09756 [Pistacia atlantica]|uniref:Uncharacterized protein n=1 Tax=Pistacia atlantica TaxID=434234 RepID=A0ACC1A353_9ROSI|nr:hypothetical protein Patl1_09756 [Pistacia atlantica]
MSGICAYSQG